MSKRKQISDNDSHSELIKLLAEMNKKMDSLSEIVHSFKNDGLNKIVTLYENFETFKTAMQKQNALVVDVLGENNVAFMKVLKNQNSLHTKIFPIKSVEALNKLEESIDESNEHEFTIRAVTGRRGVRKGLPDIVPSDVLSKFNVEGTFNKLRLLNYKKFINVLFLGSYDKDASKQSFKDDLKHALRLAKNRWCKEKSKENKKNRKTYEGSDEREPEEL